MIKFMREALILVKLIGPSPNLGKLSLDPYIYPGILGYLPYSFSYSIILDPEHDVTSW